MNSGIYSITHTGSSRVYIGSSADIDRRWKIHRRHLNKSTHHNKYLQRLWNKHGDQSFVFKILLICAKQHLLMYEQLLLDNLKPDLNATKNAYGPTAKGQKLSQLQKEQISQFWRRLYASGFVIKHPPRSQEYRAYVSKQALERWQDPVARDKIIAAMKASMTDEEKAKKSERIKLLWASQEYRQRAVEARKGHAWNKGYKCTPEQVENRRRAARISNMKRNYGEQWVQEYRRRYPEHVEDVNG